MVCEHPYVECPIQQAITSIVSVLLSRGRELRAIISCGPENAPNVTALSHLDTLDRKSP